MSLDIALLSSKRASVTWPLCSIPIAALLFACGPVDPGLEGAGTDSAPLVLQPGPAEGKDALVISHPPSANNNYGNRIEFTAGTWTNSGNVYHVRSFLGFDLSAIPPGTTIQSATLDLHAETTSPFYGQGISNSLPLGHSTLSGSNASYLRRVTSPWQENTVTWNSQPSTTVQNQIILPSSSSPSQDYLGIDVTALVQDMVNDPAGSHGFGLQLVTEAHYREVTFASSDHSIASLRPRLEVVLAQPSGPVPGYADLHLHMMAAEAFGGGWMHGSHESLPSPCDGGFPPSDHARVKQDISQVLQHCTFGVLDDIYLLDLIQDNAGVALSEFIGATEGSQGDTGLHLLRRHQGADWPSWDTIAHQQVATEWLEDAHARGLNLVVMSAVSYDWLCQLMPTQNLDRPGCDEMVDVKLQLELAQQLDVENDWLEIALDPQHAREIIRAGKLAMVLSIETSHLFGRDASVDWRSEFDEVYAMGVRTLQPVHQTDNRFAGAALHNVIFQIAQFSENCHIDLDCGVTTDNLTLGFDVELQNGECRNTLGLTDQGRDLINLMMDRGMPIDLAHLSEASVRDTFDIAVQRDYYPLYVSHGHFRELMMEDFAKAEKTSPSWVISMIRKTGGIFGLRTFHEETRAYEYSSVEPNCQGSSRSFAQALEFGVQGLKVPLAFATDLNGFVQQTRPRFGSDACSATAWDRGLLLGPFEAHAHCEARTQRIEGPSPLGTPFDEKGLAHIGLLPDLLADLQQLGSDTTSLENSAEAFIRMWERAHAPRSGPADSAGDMDLAGIGPNISRDEHEDAYPKQCNKHYCPEHLELGEECRFDGECISDRCVAAVPQVCGLPKGHCVCDEHADCPPDHYCRALFRGWTGDGCEPMKVDGDACSADWQCFSGSCGGCAGLTGWCYTPDSQSYGESCRADKECITDRCSADCYLNPTGSCLCKSDSDCGSGQYCGWGTNSGECRDKKGRGALCLNKRECLSDKCKFGFCK